MAVALRASARPIPRTITIAPAVVAVLAAVACSPARAILRRRTSACRPTDVAGLLDFPYMPVWCPSLGSNVFSFAPATQCEFDLSLPNMLHILPSKNDRIRLFEPVKGRLISL